jgi:uncharacterized phage infection (PIP) family protein YhgE
MLLISVIIAGVISLMFSLVLLYLILRNSRRVNAYLNLLQQQFRSLVPQMQALLNADVSLNKRFREFQTQYDQLSESLNQMTQTKQVSSYSQAIKLAEMGANLDEIRSTCHLSQAECELLLNLQGYKFAKPVNSYNTAELHNPGTPYNNKQMDSRVATSVVHRLADTVDAA